MCTLYMSLHACVASVKLAFHALSTVSPIGQVSNQHKKLPFLIGVKMCFSLLADVCLISPRKANRSALAVLRLISCLRTYLLFWWSQEWIADVSLKVTCGLSFSSIYKRTGTALKSICWMLRGWETLLYSILYHSSYITQTATELKHSEGAIFIQLCLLHWGRLDVSAFKSLCELFHSELGPFHGRGMLRN